MDTRFLESFVIVADCGSIAEAARRQNLTAAAVAQRLRALEVEMDQSLVKRVGRTSQLTASGLAILPHARAMIRSTRNLRAIAAQDEPAGQLRLGATATALTGQIPDIIAALQSRHPSVDYFLQPGASVDLYHSVLSDDLDAAIIMQPPFSLPKSAQWRTLRSEPFVLLAPEKLKLSDYSALLTAHPFIRYDRNQWGGQIIDRFLHKQGINVREVLELDALDSIAALVSRGLGVAIVPDWAPPWPEGLRLRKLPLSKIEHRQIGVLWRNSGTNIAALQAFVRTCAELHPRDLTWCVCGGRSPKANEVR